MLKCYLLRNKGLIQLFRKHQTHQRIQWEVLIHPFITLETYLLTHSPKFSIKLKPHSPVNTLQVSLFSINSIVHTAFTAPSHKTIPFTKISVVSSHSKSCVAVCKYPCNSLQKLYQTLIQVLTTIIHVLIKHICHKSSLRLQTIVPCSPTKVQWCKLLTQSFRIKEVKAKLTLATRKKSQLRICWLHQRCVNTISVSKFRSISIFQILLRWVRNNTNLVFSLHLNLLNSSSLSSTTTLQHLQRIGNLFTPNFILQTFN